MTGEGNYMFSNNQLKSKSIRQEVVQIIRRKILRGELLPGDRIIEAEIAAQLEISRGPVREAVRQLEQEGLVTYNLHKGCSVTTLSADDAWEIYMLRAHLESLSIQMCKGNLGLAALEEMEKAAMSMENAGAEDDLAELVELDHIFHSQICKAGGKKRLYQLWSSLNSTSFAIFLTVHNANVTPLQSLQDKHMDLFKILSKGDVEESCRSITDHYLSTGQKLYDYESLYRR